jgi:hypothetical protein
VPARAVGEQSHRRGKRTLRWVRPLDILIGVVVDSGSNDACSCTVGLPVRDDCGEKGS